MASSVRKKVPAGSGPETDLWDAFVESRSASDRERLFRHYQPLARRLAASHRRRDALTPIDFGELFQLACTGLLEALDRFRPELGVPFRYFASRRINGAILNGVANYSEVNQQITTRRQVERERLASLASDPGAQKGLDDALDRLGEIAAGLALGLMIEEGQKGEGGVADPAKGAFETLAWKQMVELVRREILALPQREKDIMIWHYVDDLPFGQIARLLDLSKGRISQIHAAAIGLLRKRLTRGGRFQLEG